MAQQEYAKARLNYLPRLHVVAEYDVDQRRLFGSSADSYTVMALLNFNLFNGLTDLAKVRETRAKETQARDLKRGLEDRVRHQVTEAILNLKTAQARLGVADKAVAQARESLRLIRLRYESGLTILVDLLNAEDATKNAELSRVAALFDTYLAQAGLDLALGTISGPVAEGEVRGARAAAPVQRLLQEVNAHFTIQGKPVHPRLVEKFQTFLSDSGPPAVITVDLLAATVNGNEYYEPDVKVQDGLVSVEHKDQQGSGFAYKWLGTVRPGLHVVETFYSGGGTGVFMHLYFFRIYRHRPG